MEFTREQLQLLVDCAPEITVVYLTDDKDSVPVPFLYTSDTPAFSGLMENEYLELYRDDATKIVLPQDLPTLRHAIRSTFDNRRAEACTYRTFHKTKGMVWTHAALKWIGTFEGKQVLLGVFSDISNRVAEDTPGGFFIYAAQEDDQFFFVGENMLRMLGYTRDEFQEKFQNRFRYLIYAADRQETLESIEKQIAENGHYDKVDYRVEKKDGSLLWVHDEGHYVVDKDSRAWFYVTINDISDKIEEHDKLRKENTELAGIIRSIPVGLSVYRIGKSRMTLAAANDAICETLDVTMKQVNGGDQSIFSNRVHPDDFAALAETMHEVTKIGRHISAPFRYLRQDNQWAWLRLESETARGSENTDFSYNVITDLTAERLAEEKLETAQRAQQEQYLSSIKALIFANPQSLCTVRMNLSQNKCEEWYGTSTFVIHTIQAETAEGVIDNISRIIINDQDRAAFREHFNRAALIDSFRNGKSRDIVRYRRTIEDGTSICMGCSLCTKNYPELFEIQNKKASLKEISEEVDQEKLMNAVHSCPVKAISFSADEC